ncbi:MAG: hypothetical protein CMM58_06460 [Rhodospirillaceae bacterium]|nr:hypothetical protein [Rhodospirillaceae bacterium]
MHMRLLEDKVVLVTGAAGNLGYVVAHKVLESGAYLVATDYEGGRLKKQLKERERVSVFPDVDISNYKKCRKLIGAIKTRFRKLDCVISTVGGFAFESIENGTFETWQIMNKINVETSFNIAKAASSEMLSGSKGAIVLTGALAALNAPAGMAAYSSAKAAVMRLTESLSDELKLKGIRVNAVLPSIIDTPKNRKEMPDADFSLWVSPEEVADVMIFLASDYAKGVTGALVPVNGKV